MPFYKKADMKSFSLNYISPKVTKMGSIITIEPTLVTFFPIIGHKVDYKGLGVLGGQWHIPSKNSPKYPSPGKYPVFLIQTANLLFLLNH